MIGPTFVGDYLRHCGISEVPARFHRWVAYSVLAAVAGDRSWVEKFRGKRLTPNLYLLLLGPSGIGKGEAIDTGLRLIKDLPFIRLLRGKVTAPYFVDQLAKKQGPARTADPKVYLVTPELAMSVGRGEMANELVKLLTELYTGGDYEFHEGTRTRGTVKFSGHCVNWLAGTTKEWLRDCISRDAVEGGFFARVASVQADYDFDCRIARPTTPDEYDDLVSGLRDHLERVSQMFGPMSLTQQATDLLDDWYATRPAPDDETLIPTWRREHDLVLKLAMLESLSHGTDGTVTRRHVVAAQQLAAETTRHLPTLVEYVALTAETDGVRQVREAVRQAGIIKEASLARMMARFGVTHDKLRLYIETLVAARMIRRAPANGTGTSYMWAGKRKFSEDAET